MTNAKILLDLFKYDMRAKGIDLDKTPTEKKKELLQTWIKEYKEKIK